MAWTFLAATTAGVIQDELRARSRRVTFQLRGESSASFTVHGADAEFCDELRSDLICKRDGTTMFRGRITHGQDQLSGKVHTTQFTALDYLALLDRRILHDGDTLAWTGDDQSLIAWELIEATQAKAGGNLGITRGVGQTTGVTRDREYEPGKRIGEAIAQLSEVDDGFEYEVDHSLAFNVYYPQRGMKRDAVLLHGGNVAGVSRTVTSTEFSNAVRVSGEEDGPTATLEESATIATDVEGRWEDQVGVSDLKEQATVDARALFELTARSVLRPAYTVTLKAGAWTGPDEFWLGDVVGLTVRSGRLRIHGEPLRVTELSFEVADDGTESVQVTLGAPGLSVLRRFRSFGERLEDLERR